MYKDFYQLRENPFSVTADPEFFYSSQQHSEAFSHLQFGIDQRKGILALIGEIGTGKTTLCRRLLKELDAKTRTALILNPSFSDSQLLRIILQDLGVEGKYRSKYDLVNALNHYLLQEASRGHNVVLIIDEAQNLGVKQLEQIRLLSNLETEKQKLLQIVLMGQPELEQKLKLPSLRQLNQRIAVRYHIQPLRAEEVAHYIHHRCAVACLDQHRAPRFNQSATDTVYQLTQGTPRLINLLCDRALLSGFVHEQRTIDESMVRASAEEVLPT